MGDRVFDIFVCEMKIAADAKSKLLTDLSVEFRDDLPYVVTAVRVGLVRMRRCDYVRDPVFNRQATHLQRHCPMILSRHRGWEEYENGCQSSVDNWGEGQAPVAQQTNDIKPRAPLRMCARGLGQPRSRHSRRKMETRVAGSKICPLHDHMTHEKRF
jgi:hypothetical protein